MIWTVTNRYWIEDIKKMRNLWKLNWRKRWKIAVQTVTTRAPGSVRSGEARSETLIRSLRLFFPHRNLRFVFYVFCAFLSSSFIFTISFDGYFRVKYIFILIILTFCFNSFWKKMDFEFLRLCLVTASS